MRNVHQPYVYLEPYIKSTNSISLPAKFAHGRVRIAQSADFPSRNALCKQSQTNRIRLVAARVQSSGCVVFICKSSVLQAIRSSHGEFDEHSTSSDIAKEFLSPRVH